MSCGVFLSVVCFGNKMEATCDEEVTVKMAKDFVLQYDYSECDKLLRVQGKCIMF